MASRAGQNQPTLSSSPEPASRQRHRRRRRRHKSNKAADNAHFGPHSTQKLSVAPVQYMFRDDSDVSSRPEAQHSSGTRRVAADHGGQIWTPSGVISAHQAAAMLHVQRIRRYEPHDLHPQQTVFPETTASKATPLKMEVPVTVCPAGSGPKTRGVDLPNEQHTGASCSDQKPAQRFMPKAESVSPAPLLRSQSEKYRIRMKEAAGSLAIQTSDAGAAVKDAILAYIELLYADATAKKPLLDADKKVEMSRAITHMIYQYQGISDSVKGECLLPFDGLVTAAGGAGAVSPTGTKPVLQDAFRLHKEKNFRVTSSWHKAESAEQRQGSPERKSSGSPKNSGSSKNSSSPKSRVWMTCEAACADIDALFRSGCYEQAMENCCQLLSVIRERKGEGADSPVSQHIQKRLALILVYSVACHFESIFSMDHELKTVAEKLHCLQRFLRTEAGVIVPELGVWFAWRNFYDNVLNYQPAEPSVRLLFGSSEKARPED